MQNAITKYATSAMKIRIDLDNATEDLVSVLGEQVKAGNQPVEGISTLPVEVPANRQ
jgi:hypothetical protein